MDGIGTRPRLRAEARDGSLLIDKSYAPRRNRGRSRCDGSHSRLVAGNPDIQSDAVGHRVVHGGPQYDRPIVIDHDVLARLEQYISLAPLHQPNNLAPIRSLLERRPELVQVACFDTAFHRTHSAVVDHYAIPEQFYAEGVRRYGFHGLSYEYIADRLRDIAPDRRGRSCDRRSSRQWRVHVCAFRRKKRRKHDGLYRSRWLANGYPTRADRSGRAALSDRREKDGAVSGRSICFITTAGSKGYPASATTCGSWKRATLPARRSRSTISSIGSALNSGMLAAALGGVDAFVFTAGIGENSATHPCTRSGEAGVARRHL